MIKVAIVGYGNLGKGIENAISRVNDFEIVGVFTRRKPDEVLTLGSPVYSYSDLLDVPQEIDVCILCGGSARDLPDQTPELAKRYCVVDSYDNHSLIPQHFENVDKASKEARTTAVISSGWDPGLFSIERLMMESVLPQGETLTFWGKGVSQGHSDAIRRIVGVKDAVQYTIPNTQLIETLRRYETVEVTTRDKHKRLCYVVSEAGANHETIRNEIIGMPGYFADYDTEVNFISIEELKEHHSAMPHGGIVLRTGMTSNEHHATLEFHLDLESNPEFTASVVLAYARACYRLHQEGVFGCHTVYDIAPKYLSPKTNAQLRKELL